MGGHEGDTIGAGKGGLPAAGRDHIYIRAAPGFCPGVAA